MSLQWCRAQLHGYSAGSTGCSGSSSSGAVEGYTRISDAFVKKFLMRDGETLEQTKARIAREEEELHRQSQERVSASRQRVEEAGHKAKERAKVNNK